VITLREFLRAPFLNCYKAYYRIRGPDDCVAVMDEEWDSLLILDGCRYDMFVGACDYPGSLEKRRSCGSTTDEFVRSNLGSQRFEDVVYVSANPRVSLNFEGSFHEIVRVWEDGWDEELRTVPPWTVTDAARRAHEEFPNKRIVVHYIQPHAPFIGEYARSNLPEHSTLADHAPDQGGDGAANNIWEHLAAGRVDRATVQCAYEENLDITLEYVEPLLDDLDGRIVVTSDHGNLVGERLPPFMKRMYGHPTRLYAPGLVEVPWFVVENGQRREVVAEEATEGDDIEVTEATKAKLESLGYR